MKRVILYSLKVWLTSAILSPIMFIMGDNIVHPYQRIGLSGSLGFIAYSIPYGLVLSIPSWLILFLSAGSLVNRKLSIVYKKLIISIVGILLSILPFYLLFRNDDNGFDTYILLWLLCYCSFVIAGVWFYDLELADTA